MKCLQKVRATRSETWNDSHIPFPGVHACEGLLSESRQVNPIPINGIAENAVRRVKEGASALLVQSGFAEKWWGETEECLCYLPNVQEKLADRKSSYEKRFRAPFNGPILCFGLQFMFIQSLRSTNVCFVKLLQKCFLDYSSDRL